MKITDYNPILSISLEDLRLLKIIAEEDEYGTGERIGSILTAVISSVEENSSWTFGSTLNQYVYDRIMERVQDSIDKYEDWLISKGYTENDIHAYHQEKWDKNHKENKEN